MNRPRRRRSLLPALVMATGLAGVLTTSLTAPRSSAGFAATASNAGNAWAAAASFSSVLYLHNNPSPPIGDTTSQDPLPLSTTAPTGSTLRRYATDFDSLAGRTLQQTTLGLGVTTTRHMQRWTQPIAATTTVGPTATLSIWLAPRDFTATKTVGIVVGLYDCNAALSSCTLVSSGSTANTPWPTVWTEATVSLGPLTHVFSAGRTMMLKVAPTASADIDVSVAYDTAIYASALTIGS